MEYRPLLLGAILSNAVLLVSCGPTHTIRVTTSVDGAPGSLRDALNQAQRPPNGDVRIELPTGTYALTQCAAADDTNASGDLDSLSNLPVTLAATGPGVVIRQTCAGERVLDHRGSGLLTLIGVAIEGGQLVSDSPDRPAEGGGIRVQGNARLEDTIVRSSSATGAGTQLNTPAHGGGLFVGGWLQALNSTFSSNIANGGLASDAEGGGAYVVGDVKLNGCAFTQNAAKGGSGVPAGAARGGALAQSSSSTAPVSAILTQFVSNTVQAGRLPENIGNAGASVSGGALAIAGPFTGDHLTFTTNSAAAGMVPWTATAAGSARGGAIANVGAVDLTNSTFSDNRAIGGGGEDFCRYGSTLPGGPLIPRGCLGAGIGGGAKGAAVWSEAGVSLTNVSLDQNVGFGGVGARQVVLIGEPPYQWPTIVPGIPGPLGGAITADSITLTHVTSSNNGPLSLTAATRLTSHNSVVTQSEGYLCNGSHGAISDHNWFSDGTCRLVGSNDREEPGDFRLQALADNGGRVATLLPASGSVLIDAIPASACGSPKDARGVTRPQGPECDIGAVEVTAP
jgi:hypothetical protein